MKALRLNTRFTLFLLAVFLIGTLVAGIALWEALQRKAEAQIQTEGLALINTMSAVRIYTSQHIAPLLSDELATSDTFIAETVPAFAAREVFENMRTSELRENFFYKEATLNPTNPRDQADAFETDIVNQMRENRTISELVGFRELAGEQVFYIARPLPVNDTSCLQCHGNPETAPDNLIASYGSEGGFGWQMNEVVAAQMIYVPAEQVFDTAFQSFWLMIIIFMVIFAAVIVLINRLLRQYVIQPVGAMSGLAQRISAEEVDEDDLKTSEITNTAQRSDELGHLARVFQDMAHDVIERTYTLRQEVHKLTIEIDEIKRQRQVAEIIDTDYFQELQTKVRSIRQRRKNHSHKQRSVTSASKAKDPVAPKDKEPTTNTKVLTKLDDLG